MHPKPDTITLSSDYVEAMTDALGRAHALLELILGDIQCGEGIPAYRVALIRTWLEQQRQRHEFVLCVTKPLDSALAKDSE